MVKIGFNILCKPRCQRRQYEQTATYRFTRQLHKNYSPFRKENCSCISKRVEAEKSVGPLLLEGLAKLWRIAFSASGLLAVNLRTTCPPEDVAVASFAGLWG
jgi:hypothetical protein